jgi:hypothetical protein
MSAPKSGVPVTNANLERLSPQQFESIELKGLSKGSGIENAAVNVIIDDSNVPPSAVPERTSRHRTTERIHLLTLCWTMMLGGWNDASTGPLLPRIQKVYHLGFTVVSMLFVIACCVSSLL